MSKTNHIQKHILSGKAGPIMFPCIEVLDTTEAFDLPKPVNSKVRIFPEELFQHLLTFKFTISIDKDNTSCINTEMVYSRYVPEGICPNDQRAIDAYFVSIEPILYQFKDTVMRLYDSVLNKVMEKCEFQIMDQRMLYYVADQFKHFEHMLEIEHRVNVVQWLEINYGRLPSSFPKPNNIAIDVIYN